MTGKFVIIISGPDGFLRLTAFEERETITQQVSDTQPKQQQTAHDK